MQLSPCRRVAVLVLCLTGVAASGAAARAQARIEDCEKIQAADAYNQCLAKFGPTSKVKSVEPVKPGDVKDSSAEAAAGAAAKGSHGSRHAAVRGHGRSRGHAVSRRRFGKASVSKSGGKASGRKRMSFTVKKHR